MADPRLQWRALNTAQPNVAGLLRNSAQSFNEGIESAQNILGKYDEGLVSKNDVAVANELAALDTQEEIDAYFAGGGLKGRKVSEQLLADVQGRQGLVTGFGNTRSQIRDRDGRLGIANRNDARIQTTFDRGIAREDELAGLSDEVVAARLEGQEFGEYGVPRGSPMENYLNSTIQSESSGDPNARNPNSSATGLAQFTSGTWDQMRAKYPELGLTEDGRTDPEQAKRALAVFTRDNARFLESAGFEATEGNLYAAHFLGNGGARSVLSASDDTLVSERIGADALEANPFLRGMTVGEFKEWSTQKGGGNASRTPARDRLQEAVANSQYLGLDEVNKILNGNDAKIDEGDTALATQLKQNQQDLIAAVVSQGVANPENLTADQVARQVEEAALASGDFSSAEAIQARRAAEAMIGESGSLQTELAPAVRDNVDLANDVDNSIADATRRFEGQDQNRALGDISRYTEDPTGNLVSDLGIGSDGENPGGIIGLLGGESGFDQNSLRNLVNEYANKFNVEPSVVAVAMRDSFDRDPLGRNTLRSRFDEDAVKAAVDQLGPDARQQYDRGSSRIEIATDQLRQLQSQERQLRQRIAKLDEGDPRRASFEAQLAALDAQMASIELSAPPSNP